MQKAKEFKWEELNIKTNLEVATTELHNDIYNIDLQGKVGKYKHLLEESDMRKVKGAVVRSRVKWQMIGDKCTSDYFKSVRQKNTRTIISELKDKYGRIFTKSEELGQICLDFYQDLYQHKGDSEEAIKKILEDLPRTFTVDMNTSLSEEITEAELSSAVQSMAKGKAPGHDGIPMEFFQKYWATIGGDFYRMVKKNLKLEFLTKGNQRVY